MFAPDIGIDLGTANVLVYVRRKGVVIQEPSVVAVDNQTHKVLAVGESARQMIGRTPGNIVAIRPLRDGVIVNYDITETMLKYFIARACGRRKFFRPRMVICVPSGVTGVEKRAVVEAAYQAGGKKVVLVSEPMAAAIGAGLDVTEPSGKMVVDVGGGTTDIAVISLGGEVVSDSVRIGGDKFDEAIVRQLRKEFNLLIGERTAEEIKIETGSVDGKARERAIEVRGRDMVSGLPKTVRFTTSMCREALMEPMMGIIDAIKSVLERTPPEMASDIIDRGIVVTGGGALVHGFTELVSRHTGVPVNLAEEPMSCVALGTGRILEKLDDMKPEMIVGGRG